MATRGKRLDPKNESVEQRLAFEEYLKLGDERSLAKVAEKSGRTEITIGRWSKAFDWVERAKQVDVEHIDTASIESLPSQMEGRKRNLKLIDIMLRETAVVDDDGNIVSSNVKLKSMSDIRTALEVREALLGSAKANSGRPGGTIENIEKAVFIIKKG